MTAYADINQTMQELTGVKYSAGEQNKEMAKSTQEIDMGILAQYFVSKNIGIPPQMM